MKYLGAALMVLGFVVTLGTAGASDQGAITFGQTVVQALAGMVVFGAGVLFHQIAEEIKETKQRKEKSHEPHHH